jgi:Amt family ammonium transporter
MHPMGSLLVGAVAGGLFVWLFTLTQNKLKIDDVLGVWPLHGVCGAWGGVAAGIFGSERFGGLGGVSLVSQLMGTAFGIAIALATGFGVYALLKVTVGIRLSEEEEYLGADLSIHKVSSSPTFR